MVNTVRCKQCGFKHVERTKNNLYYCYVCKEFFLEEGDIKPYHLKKVHLTMTTKTTNYEFSLYIFDIIKIMSGLKTARYKRHHDLIKKFLDMYDTNEKVGMDYTKTKIGVICMKDLLEEQ